MTLHCLQVQDLFADYLDGTVTGVEMSAIASHMEGCAACAADFDELRELQRCLAGCGSAQPPAALQSRLRAAIADERARGTHLKWSGRLALAWERTLAPLAGRVAAAGAMAVVLGAGVIWMFGTPLLGVQANDDRLAHMVAPRYLYSQAPPQQLAIRNDVPMVVDAMIDDQGRVYDFAVLEGPHDADLHLRLQQNLLTSVFKPATVFGVAVRGHVVLTYMGVSVHG